MTATGERRTGAPGGDAAAPGLSALYAALDAAARRHQLDALAVAVDDPDLGRQAFAAGADAATALAALADDPHRRWWATPEPDEAPAELDALTALARTAVRLGVADPAADPASALEVFVRGLPAVATVLRTGTVVEVTVAPGTGDEVVRHLAAATLPGSGAVVVHDAAATPTGPPDAAEALGRAELVAVRSLPESGELEVHLRSAFGRTVGRGPLARAGAAAADATLEALAALHPDPTGAETLRVGWVRTIDTTPDREFLVAVTIRRDRGSTLYGLATGASPIEAAARATLHACNRVVGWPSTS
ncbi:MAG: hypothetical protein WDA60_07040 [Acidimicrobiia bacterium]